MSARDRRGAEPARPPLALMALEAATLFVLTPKGRILRDNDPFGPGPAPRFFLGRTPAGNVWRCGQDLPAALCRELEGLAGSEPVCPDPARLAEEARVAPALRAALARHGPIQGEFRGPAYSLPPARALPAHPGAVLITAHNADLLGPAFADLRPVLEGVSPCAAVLEGGRAVAVCFSSRLSPGAAEAGVETLPTWRRRGYGAAAVATWAAAVRREGRLPLYSTTWDNRASQGLARSLGFVLYGEDFSLA